MIKYIIIDIDGTIADCSKRVHHLEQTPKNWDAFYADMEHDAPITPTLQILSILVTAGLTPIFITGRDEKYRQVTLSWLRKHAPWATSRPYLYMRKNGDRTEDNVIKEEVILTPDCPCHPNNTVVFEDRSRVIAMWRKLGFTAYQVAEGNF